MSFSYQVKEELSSHVQNARHCQMAELAAIVMNVGEFQEDGSLNLRAENDAVLRKARMIINKMYDYEADAMVQSGSGGPCLAILDGDCVEKIRKAVKYDEIKEHRVSQMVIKNACCKRAFLEDMFLCIGSMSDPEKSYHLEFVCVSELEAKQLQEILRDFDIEAKITARKKHFIVYLKEGTAIVELLNIIGAHKALMEMENLRILKEVRNDVNRRCNCDAANINKSLQAAEKQIADIEFLRDNMGFAKLPENLREIAIVRLEHPDASLKELGEFLNPPVGKSGVNHRLRKLSEMAEKMR